MQVVAALSKLKTCLSVLLAALAPLGRTVQHNAVFPGNLIREHTVGDDSIARSGHGVKFDLTESRS